MTNLEQEAFADLKSKVAEFMDDAKRMALEKLDKLQASGCDIVGDHMAAKGPWAVPREFIAAMSEELKAQLGLVTTNPRDRTRNKRIKNYWRLM